MLYGIYLIKHYFFCIRSQLRQAPTTHATLAIDVNIKFIGSLQLCHFNIRTCTIAINVGYLKNGNMTLTYLEQMFLNRL